MSTIGQAQTFDELSAAVAREFLQTVVVVDDQAFFTPLDRPQTSALREPGDEDAISEDGGASVGTISDTPPVVPVDLQHNLDAKRLIDVFADHGLVCAVLRPEQQGEPLLARTLKAANRADLLVLDWQLHGDNGVQTMSVISALVAADQGRLRMIAIYTGDNDIEPIVAAVAASLGLAPPTPERDEDRFVLRHGPVRIAVFAKDHVHVPQSAANQRLAVEDLPRRLIKEFSAMTAGLVSNVALEALAVLRANTHPLLATLHPGLDAPYLTQRALMPQPGDAAELLVALVVAELRSILEEHGVGGKAGMASVDPWLDARHSEPFTFRVGNRDMSVQMEDVREWLTTGNRPDALGKRERHGELTGQFCRVPENAVKLDAEFAVLTALRTRYAKVAKPPMLTLGTIVAEDPVEGREGTLYWLCIQPQCDSVRLVGERAFPFLPYAVAQEGESFGLTIKERDGTYIRLRLEAHPYRCRMIGFTAGSQDDPVVRSASVERGFIFAGAGGVFRWVAELKHEQAQRVVNDYAAALARPGVDESEWLRRSAK
jgi:hypothetical protein